MNVYSRPIISEAVYLDEAGNVIQYGNRYEAVDGGDALTHEQTNQERFLPIFTVAQALLDYVHNEYDVELIEGLSSGNQFDLNPTSDSEHFARVVHVKPAGANQPSIWIGFSHVPGVIDVRAGHFSSFDMWFCGCDRCDDRWEDTADSLEFVILAIAETGLTERVDRLPWGRARYWLHPDRSREWSGSIPRSNRVGRFSSDRLLLSDLPNGSWEGFTRRK